MDFQRRVVFFACRSAEKFQARAINTISDKALSSFSLYNQAWLWIKRRSR